MTYSERTHMIRILTAVVVALLLTDFVYGSVLL